MDFLASQENVKTTSLKAFSPSGLDFLPTVLTDPFLLCIFFFQPNQKSTENWRGSSEQSEILFRIFPPSQVVGTCCSR